MEKVSNNKTNWLFELGLILLPFENFFFAPSAGWAALTPIVFFFYFILNMRAAGFLLKKHIKIIAFIFIGIILTTFSWLTSNLNILNLMNAIVSIGLGIIVLFSINIYYEKNKFDKVAMIKRISKIILYSYLTSFIIGIIEFITVKFNVSILYNFFHFIFKRDYLHFNRIQFFYSEPSFIGMHLFGILLPWYLISKDKKILKLLIIYSAGAIFFASGVRIFLDVLVVGFIFLLGFLLKKRYYILILIIPLLCGSLFYFGYNNNYRIKQIVDNGVYADGSLASRYFRINASIKGYKKDGFHFFFGYGLGNSMLPIKEGYSEAVSEYKNSYTKEVIELGNSSYSSDSVSYCLFIRIISEYGFILFLFALIYIFKIVKNSNFKMKWYYLLDIIYIYVQFESFAFYALWLFIIVMLYTSKKEEMFNEK